MIHSYCSIIKIIQKVYDRKSCSHPILSPPVTTFISLLYTLPVFMWTPERGNTRLATLTKAGPTPAILHEPSHRAPAPVPHSRALCKKLLRPPCGCVVMYCGDRFQSCGWGHLSSYCFIFFALWTPVGSLIFSESWVFAHGCMLVFFLKVGMHSVAYVNGFCFLLGTISEHLAPGRHLSGFCRM